MIISMDFHRENGQSTTEYALIIALVSGLLIFSLTNYGNALLIVFQNILKMFPTV